MVRGGRQWVYIRSQERNFELYRLGRRGEKRLVERVTVGEGRRGESGRFVRGVGRYILFSLSVEKVGFGAERWFAWRAVFIFSACLRRLEEKERKGRFMAELLRPEPGILSSGTSTNLHDEKIIIH